MKINENSEFTLDLKTIALIIGFVISLSATYFTLMAEVEIAKTLPEMPISEKEFELKDKLIRASILSTQEDVKEIKEDMKYLRNKMDNVN
jgi:hypothetical protein|tara:strand:- start:436 stop:705 length:270 start_codon:yes stop_codon:yes gene_type:complete